MLNGRPPFPRIAPPFRRGADEVVDDDVTDTDDAVTSTGAAVELAGPGDETPAPPALVNNVETLANVPAIIAKGAAWFREIGTNESPGSIVCTVTGSVHRHGVAEVPMGTTVADAIELIGGGAMRSAGLIGVLNGASNALLPATALSTPLTYEDMQAAGVALGSASLTVLDEGDDLVAVAAGYARFLAVESCGQCTPCKEDGLAISDRLAALCADDADDGTLDEIRARLATVADGARCNLARQTQVLVGSLVDANPAAFEARPDPDPDPEAPPVEPIVVGEVADIVDDRAQLLPDAATKQPDWTHDGSWSGAYPAAIDTDG
ncbi:MAG: NADH-ubiquinone oxidoreductase-F iron-sulfur binding region domain-containing protein [Ilumatobacteraceae bacterium]